MELAAIATAAVPGLSPVGVGPLADDVDDFDSALVRDAQHHQWRVRAPRHDEASMRLETELAALRAFTPGVRAALGFHIPSVAGTVRQGSLRTFVYNHLDGRSLSLDELVGEGGTTAAHVGRAIAEIHGLDDELVERADLPSYSAEQFRQRRLNALDQAATTGQIPARLLRRWEHALEDVSLWRFNPTVVHGDFHEDHLLISQGHVSAVTGWTDLHVGDPADDLAWLAAAHEQSFSDAVYEAYAEARGEKADPHIMRRAALSAEFALAQWLVKAMSTEDAERIDEAVAMLADLDQDIADYGGQPISVVEPPRVGSGPSAGSAAEAEGDGSTADAVGESSAAPDTVTSAVVELEPVDDEAEHHRGPESEPGHEVEAPPAREEDEPLNGPEQDPDAPAAPSPRDTDAGAGTIATPSDGAAEGNDAAEEGSDVAAEEITDEDSAPVGKESAPAAGQDEDATSAIPVIQLPSKRDADER
nr:phosphotransferase [Zhihengliuella flava]